MSLNLSKINPDDFFSDLVDKLNSNFEAISNSNGGPEGKQGNPGSAGLPGPRGPVGEKGLKGDKGTVWHKAVTDTTLPTTDVLENDFVIVTNTGNFYQYISSSWVLVGTFNFSKGLTIDKEDNIFNSSYSKIASELKSIINSKTNYNLILTNMDRPDPDLGVQIPNADSPGDSYPLVQGDDASYSHLYDYKLKVYTSGNSEDDSEQIYGRNLHLANSFSMITKAGWLKASGFTVSSDLDINSVNSTTDGTEILSITGINSGSPAHLHRVQIDNSDFWVSSFRVGKNGKASLGFENTYTPSQKLDIDGGILLGTTSVNVEGSVRYNGTNFQGYNGNSWVNLDISVNDLLNTLANDITSFKNKVLRTDTTGGVVLGDMSIETTPPEGSIRYNLTTKDFEGYNGTSWVTLNNKVLPNTDNDSGGGFLDSEGNSISSKIAVNSDGTNEAGPLIYSGIIFTSEDGSIDISQDVIDSQYAKIKLSSRGSFGSTDSDGNPVSINEIDITSNDIGISKTVDSGKLTYNLDLTNSEKFKDAVLSGIDIRSSDGSIIAKPPTKEKSFWDLTVSGFSNVDGSVSFPGGSSDSISQLLKGVSKYQISSNRYTQTSSDVLSLTYSATLGGSYSYLSFTNKDFDENCNVTSTDPFEVTISDNHNGIYHVSARSRFTYDTKPTNATSLKLVVLKSNTIVSVLNEINNSDLGGTISTGTAYELQGSDTIDLSCVTGDCNSILRIAIIAGDGTDSGQVTITDSSVAIYKVVSISQNRINDYINSSNTAFKTITTYDTNEDYYNIESTTLSGVASFKSGTYGNVYISGDNVVIDANITAIKQQIESVEGVGALTPGFSNLRVGAFTTQATSNSIIEIAGSEDIDVTLSGNKVVISAKGNAASTSNYYNNNTLIESSYTGNIIFKSGLTATSTSNGIEVVANSTINGTIPSIHVYTDYYPDLFNIADAFTSMRNGMLFYNDYDIISSNKVGSIKYKTSSEEFIDSGVGSISATSPSDDLSFTPDSTGKYEISINVKSSVILTNKSFKTSWKGIIEKPILNIGLFRLDGGSIGFGAGNSGSGISSTFIKNIASSTIDVKMDKSFDKTKDKFNRSEFPTISGSTIIELTKNVPYGLGIYKGINYPDMSLIISGAATEIKTINTSKSLKIVLMDADINIKKIS